MIRLEQLRYDAGLTPEQLAERVGGVSGKTVRNIENGNSRPRPATAKAIADYFDITATELLRPALPPLEKEAA